MHLARLWQVVDVYLDLVELVCCLREAHEPVNPDDNASATREWQRVKQTSWTHVFCLCALTGFTGANECLDVAGLTRPKVVLRTKLVVLCRLKCPPNGVLLHSLMMHCRRFPPSEMQKRSASGWHRR